MAGATVVAVFGCGDRGSSTSAPLAAGTGAAAGAARISATASAEGKPGPPVDVELSVTSLLAVGQAPISVRLSMLAGRPVARASADVAVSGPLSLVGNHGDGWAGVGAHERRTTEAGVRVDGLGHGEIRGTVTVTGQSEADGQGRTAVLYVLATGDEVLIGPDGPTALELLHLDHLRASQHLSDDDYIRRRDQIISGG